MANSIKAQVMAAMKDAMKAREKERLNAIRLILSEFKRIEVDERISLDENDERALAILDKMQKQRRDASDQFKQAGRDDLVEKEEFELTIIQEFMPAQLTDEEIMKAIDEAVSSTGANSIKDMGKVMGILKPKLQGRADLGAVSTKIKQRLQEA